MRWYAGLFTEAEKLAEQPNGYPVAREDSRFDVTVRELLYRLGRTYYRVLFHVLEPAPDEEDGTVYVLHVRNAVRLPLGEEADE